MSALDDLPVKGADAVDTVVDFIQNKAVRPLTLATRGIVFGIIVFTASIVTITLLAITLIRVLTVYIPGNRVWVSDLIVGRALRRRRHRRLVAAHRPVGRPPKPVPA